MLDTGCWMLNTRTKKHEEKLDADCADYAEKYSHGLTRITQRENQKLKIKEQNDKSKFKRKRN